MVTLPHVSHMLASESQVPLRPQESILKYQMRWGGGGKAESPSWNWSKIKMVPKVRSLLCVRVCEEASKFHEWPGGLMVKRGVLGEDRF